MLLSGGKEAVKRPIERFVWHQPVEIDHPQSAIRRGDYKVLYYWDTKEAMLFDLKNDLGETRDLSRQRSDITEKLVTELKAHVLAGLGAEAVSALERGEVSSGKPKGKGKGKGKPKN